MSILKPLPEITPAVCRGYVTALLRGQPGAIYVVA